MHLSCQPSDFEHRAGPCTVGQLLGLDGLHLLAVDRPLYDAQYPRGLLRLTVQTDPPEVVACRTCGVLAVDHGRREHRPADAPAFAIPVQLL